jgi:hypothetical protein
LDQSIHLIRAEQQTVRGKKGILSRNLIAKLLAAQASVAGGRRTPLKTAVWGSSAARTKARLFW